MKKEKIPKNTVFNLVTPFPPAGDQPRAIAELIEGYTEGEKKKQTLFRNPKNSLSLFVPLKKNKTKTPST